MTEQGGGVAHSGDLALQRFGAEGDQASKDDGTQILRHLRTLVIQALGALVLKSFTSWPSNQGVPEHVGGAGG
jgi:hypothetical protein